MLPELSTYHLAPVHGASMEPTLVDGQTVCFRELSATWYQPARGDIVVFSAPTEPGRRYVKRLVGLPGDELRFEGGSLLVNGIKLELPSSALDQDLVLSVKVPNDSFYALGDHAAVSWDSRQLGPVSMNKLIGPLVF
jgi:signal peptidase I